MVWINKLTQPWAILFFKFYIDVLLLSFPSGEVGSEIIEFQGSESQGLQISSSLPPNVCPDDYY